MCLDSRWTKKQINDWLKKRPDTITAYKAVRVALGGNTVVPPCYGSTGSYNKINKMGSAEEHCRSFIQVTDKSNHADKIYKPHYHLFRTKVAAGEWLKFASARFEILKCEIPKKAITTIGRQDGCIVIITTEFTFVEGDKYFKEEE